MYYFGTNLESRFSVPGFWPTQEQSHKIPFEKEEIRAEIERYQRVVKARRDEERNEQLERARMVFAQGKREEENGHKGGTETVS